MTGWSSGCTGEVSNDTTAKSIPKKAQPTCSMSVITAKILEMYIPTEPGRGGVIQGTRLGPIRIEQMTGPAEKGKGIAPHRRVFALETLRVAALILGQNAWHTLRLRHTCTFPLGVCRACLLDS